MSGDGELKIEIDGTLQQKYDMITAFSKNREIVDDNFPYFDIYEKDNDESKESIENINLSEYLSCHTGSVILDGYFKHGSEQSLPDKIFVEMAKAVPQAYMKGYMEIENCYYDKGETSVELYDGKLYCIRTTFAYVVSNYSNYDYLYNILGTTEDLFDKNKMQEYKENCPSDIWDWKEYNADVINELLESRIEKYPEEFGECVTNQISADIEGFIFDEFIGGKQEICNQKMFCMDVTKDVEWEPF